MPIPSGPSIFAAAPRRTARRTVRRARRRRTRPRRATLRTARRTRLLALRTTRRTRRRRTAFLTRRRRAVLRTARFALLLALLGAIVDLLVESVIRGCHGPCMAWPTAYFERVHAHRVCAPVWKISRSMPRATE